MGRRGIEKAPHDAELSVQSAELSANLEWKELRYCVILFLTKKLRILVSDV